MKVRVQDSQKRILADYKYDRSNINQCSVKESSAGIDFVYRTGQKCSSQDNELFVAQTGGASSEEICCSQWLEGMVLAPGR